MCCMKYFTKSFLYYQQGHKSLRNSWQSLSLSTVIYYHKLNTRVFYREFTIKARSDLPNALLLINGATPQWALYIDLDESL